jgi:hypothetical protein
MSPEELGKRAAIIHHRAKALRLQMVPLSKWDKLVAEAERLKRRAYAQSKN